MRWRVAALVLVLGLAWIAGHGSVASAAQPMALTVWSGERGPGGASRGVTLNANGKGRLLDGPARLSATTRGLVVGAFAPSAAQAAAIRKAAAKVLAGKAVIGSGLGGRYVAVSVRRGTVPAYRLALVRASPQMLDLLTKLDAILPANRQLGASAIEPIRRTRAADSLFPCAPGQQPLVVQKNIELKKAAELGIVELSPKDGIGPEGDNVSIKAKWADPPVGSKATLNIQIVTDEADKQKVAADYETRAELALNIAMQGLARPMDVDLNVAVRGPNEPPLQCYHQIQMLKLTPSGAARSGYDANAIQPGAVYYGWITDKPGGDALWAHELGHLLGYKDRYTDYVTLDGVDIEVAVGSQEEADLIAKGGKPKSVTWPGHEKDIMGESHSSEARFQQEDLDFLYKSRGKLVIEGDPGTLLLDKHEGVQNFAIANKLGLDVPNAGEASSDGVYTYCIDKHRSPFPTGFDVFGPVTGLGHPATEALTRILTVVSTRPQGAKGVVPGAQHAIWRVTDDIPLAPGPEGDAARSILAEAGVADSGTYDFPHVTTPAGNQGRKETRATTLAGPLPTLAPLTFSVRAGRLTRMSAAIRTTGRGRSFRRFLIVALSATGAEDEGLFVLQRRVRGRWQRVRALGPHDVIGRTMLINPLAPLARGRYRVTQTGIPGVRSTTFSVR